MDRKRIPDCGGALVVTWRGTDVATCAAVLEIGFEGDEQSCREIARRTGSARCFQFHTRKR